jgi:L-threonylcarbamoyladenylate synthase
MNGPHVVSPRQLDEVLIALGDGRAVAVPGDGGYYVAVRDAPGGRELLRTGVASSGDAVVQIVVGDRTQAAALAAPWSKQTSYLTDRMWPGPLTVMLRARMDEVVPSAAGDPVVHLSMPGWRPVRTLARRSGPLAVVLLRGPDGEPLVSADEVQAQLGPADEVAFIVDGGVRRGPTSTVVDCTVSPPRVQRVGALPESYIEAALLMGERKRSWFTRRSPDDKVR